MTTFLYSHNPKSASSAAICQGLPIKRIKNENSKFKGKGNSVINWGSSQVIPEVAGADEIFNRPEEVAVAVNKRSTLQRLHQAGVSVPPFTSELETVKGWLKEGHLIFARTKLTGSSGEGIVKVKTEEDLAKVPANTFFTLYIPKRQEFRVHMADRADVFLIQEKKKRLDHPLTETDFEIRSHDNGFVFTREDVNPPEQVVAQARAAFQASRLNFGAIDVIYNQRRKEAFVLEINTAPGLEGQTVEDYVRVLRLYL